MAFKLCIIAIACALVSSAYAKSDGAPLDSCGDLVPQHGVDPQTGPSPYTVSLSRKAIRSGDTVEVEISGKGAQDTIKGFLVQGRVGNKVVGTFIVSPNDKFVQAISCPGGSSNAVTHKKHPENEDKKSFKVSWTAPRDFRGTVIFKATVALNGGVFWVAIPSEPLRVY